MNKEEAQKLANVVPLGGTHSLELDALFDLAVNKVCLEIGSFLGRSSVSIGCAGKLLVCIDAWDNDLEFIEDDESRKHYKRLFGEKGDGEYTYNKFLNHTSIIKEKVLPLRGISTQVIPLLPDDYFDFIFIDGDHSYAGVSKDTFSVLRKLKVGGIIATDNVLYPEKFRPIMEKFVNHVKKIPNIQTFTLDLGNGEQISMKTS